MKNSLSLILLILALLLTGIITSAQAQAAPMPRATSFTATPSKDYVTMKDGQMMKNKGGKMMPMTSNVMMRDGAVVRSDGTCRMKNGTIMKMAEGQRMMMDGIKRTNLMKGGMMKDGKMDHMNHMKR